METNLVLFGLHIMAGLALGLLGMVMLPIWYDSREGRQELDYDGK